MFFLHSLNATSLFIQCAILCVVKLAFSASCICFNSETREENKTPAWDRDGSFVAFIQAKLRMFMINVRKKKPQAQSRGQKQESTFELGRRKRDAFDDWRTFFFNERYSLKFIESFTWDCQD